MPLHKVKSRVRFQGYQRKTKQDDGGKAQYKPTRTIFDGTPRSPLFSDTVDETLFARKRVPSTDELDDLLHSNLSTSLAAEKACLEPQSAKSSPLSPVCHHIERLQEEDDDTPCSLLELAPLVCASRDHLEPTEEANVVNEANDIGDGPSASLLATTAIYAPLNDRRGQEVPAPAAPSDTTAGHDGEDHKAPQASSSAPIVDTNSPVNSHVEPAERHQAYASLAANSCAIEDNDELDDQPAFPRSSTAPIRFQKHQITFLKRVVTLFAGRRRYRGTTVEEQRESTTPLCSPPQPSAGSPCCSPVSENGSAAHLVSSSPVRPRPPPRRATSHFARATARKNLPISPPIVVPRQHRPYCPLDERLDQLVIEPAREHRFTGTDYVAPDIFEPAGVQIGFPGSPNSPKQNSDGKLLDRDGTVWGKWYARYPNPEDLPFAAAYHGQAEEDTEQEVWDMHAAVHAKFRKAPPPPTSEEEQSRQLDDEEHERAARLRYHTGHCFGALTGDCYPFQSGFII